MMMKQKFPEKPKKTPEIQTQKNLENSGNTKLQEEPMKTRGEKYNLQPIPIPNDSDSYGY